MPEFKRSRTCILVLAGLSLLASCKHKAATLKDASQDALTKTNEFDEIFRKAVNAERFDEALQLTCAHFALQCKNMGVSPDESKSARAVTYPYTNKIVLYPGAFSFMGIPHAGWLASIIEHENFHTRQSMYIRAVVMGPQARILGDRSYEAGVEYEAWDYQLKQADRFHLNCEMVLEIERQLYFYGKILQNKGRGPLDEAEEVNDFTMPDQEQRIVFKRCERSRSSSVSK